MRDVRRTCRSCSEVAEEDKLARLNSRWRDCGAWERLPTFRRNPKKRSWMLFLSCSPGREGKVMNGSQRERIKENGRRSVRDRFTLDRQMRELASLCERWSA